MSTRTLLPLFSTLALGLMLSTPAVADCADVDGWNDGRQGKAAQAQCESEAYAEAFRLGEALAELQTRHAALEAKLQTDTADAGVVRRQQRQLAVDIEAIHGVATLRGWPVGTGQGETR